MSNRGGHGGSGGYDAKSVWQDREIKFDLPLALLRPRRNEVEIDSINSVEDCKLSTEEKGALSITNLRIIWLSHKDPSVNISIGYGCIVNTSIRNTISNKHRGSTQSLYLITKVILFYPTNPFCAVLFHVLMLCFFFFLSIHINLYQGAI